MGKILTDGLNLRAMINAGIHVTRDELNAAELYALLIIAEEERIYEMEKARR